MKSQEKNENLTSSLPRQKIYSIPCTPLARSWAKIALCKNVMKCDGRTHLLRAIPLAMIVKITSMPLSMSMGLHSAAAKEFRYN